MRAEQVAVEKKAADGDCLHEPLQGPVQQVGGDGQVAPSAGINNHTAQRLLQEGHWQAVQLALAPYFAGRAPLLSLHQHANQGSSLRPPI